MSGIAICTDASALVPAEVVARGGVTIVPIPVAVDGEPFLEGHGVDAFYARLEAGGRAVTSQPSPGDFLEAYVGVARRGAEVLSIHMDARSSGTVASADLAAREAPIPVTVVDTETASFGVGACVRAALELVSTGAPSDEVAREVRRLGRAMGNAFVATGASEGRVGRDAPSAVLAFSEGVVRPLAAAEGDEDATNVIARLVGASTSPVRAAVGHAATSSEPAADELALALADLPHVIAVERYRVGPAVGAHTGPHCFGAFWWPAEPRPPRRSGGRGSITSATSGSGRGNRSREPA